MLLDSALGEGPLRGLWRPGLRPITWESNTFQYPNLIPIVLFMMVIIVIACVLSAIMLIWEPPCESWSLPGWFENRADQLSQVGSQMNIITSKHTLLYNCIVCQINQLWLFCSIDYVSALSKKTLDHWHSITFSWYYCIYFLHQCGLIKKTVINKS